MTTPRPLLAVAASTLAMMVAGTAHAQAQQADAPVATASDTPPASNDIVVTGSRTTGRSRLASSSPVDVLSAETLQHQGTPQLASALAAVAPSIDFPRSAAVDTTDSIRPITLRGLSPDQTLVLIDGVRGHSSALLNTNGSVGRGSAAFDLDTIPTVALGSVEVLRDGASAQYGSDAIAGVINLRLRKADHGGGANVSFGEYVTDVSTARTNYHRNDGRTVDVSAWQGFKLGDGGFLTVSGDYQNRDRTSRGDLDRRVTPNAIISHFGDPKVEQYSGFVNFSVPVGAVWSVYGHGGYQHRDSTSAAFYRLAGNVNTVPSIYPNGFLPRIGVRSDDFNGALGVKGVVSGWNVDFNTSFGANALRFDTRNSINSTYGAASPTEFYDGRVRYSQVTAGLDVDKQFGLGSGTLNVAWGIDSRYESFKITPGQVESYARGPLGGNTALGSGAQGFQGFTPANALDRHRGNIGIYLDLEAKIADLTLGLAGRGEGYSDFGTTGTGKFSARYDFGPHFALRGTVSNGFRAPSLQQSFYTLTQPLTTNVNGVATIVDTGLYPSTYPVATALGGKPLQPEKSFNLSGGGVLRFGGFDLSVDAYQIKIRDQIALSDNLGSGVNNTAAIAALLAPFNVTAARFFVNGLRSTTKGIDIIAHYRTQRTSYGLFDLTTSANLNEVKITSVPTGTGTVAVPALFGPQRVAAFEHGTPRVKVVGQADWSLDRFGATLRGTYYGSVTQPASSLVDYVDTGRHFLVDAELRAKVARAATLSVGANNLFDVYPNRVPGTNVLNYNNGGTAFPYYSPFGFNGRYVYGRVSLAW
ncbi:TonB-dependent receptor [Sphingomonas sp. CARO-RG-8B-R24-01]|uniref:TonB-dependent receptor plug domain-containing protein n=1 Tax=Sphingomonas sp. CARO-RG-8B-R24-01 TaxID=2914831 RepID=UPI001F58211D|nr:TonB-dependent receptor [Sphingomonas sp. CARO-RG-8B-R24-01]